LAHSAPCSRHAVATAVSATLTAQLWPQPAAVCLCLSHPAGADRHLHSFPTRRSSDLATVALRNDVGIGLVAIQTHVDERITRGADRKSTRLNSSHQIISYAGFCLKNKKPAE